MSKKRPLVETTTLAEMKYKIPLKPFLNVTSGLCVGFFFS